MFGKGFGVALTVFLLAFFVLVIGRTAWMSDDAYITYRTVENAATGHGLTWNADERVQAYTHPMWMFVSLGAFSLTGEPSMFLTGIALGLGVTLLALLLLSFGVAQSSVLALLGLTVLLCSRAFVDYATSGLENPLTHVLLALFALAYLKPPTWSARHIGLLAFIAALGILNRMDTALLFAPALAWAWLSQRTLRATAWAILGVLPFIAWEIFSVIYYGFPFPNTAYAKLGTGIPSGEMIQQGIHYFQFTFQRDPLTLPAIFVGMLAPLWLRQPRAWMLSIGIALYLMYIVKIGGDFMGGRFFTAPLFLAMILLLRTPARVHPAALAPAFAVALYLCLLAPYPPFQAQIDRKDWKGDHGVGDERRFWFDVASLQQWQPNKPMPSHSYANTGRGYRRTTANAAPDAAKLVKTHGSVGFRGFFGGPGVHIVDYYALADPLLARLPAKFAPDWRIGHFSRQVPAGYVETLASGENRFGDPALGEYYDHLSTIIRGPLWTAERWKTILAMNLGQYDHLIDDAAYRYPGLAQVTLDAVATPQGNGRTLGTNGLNVTLPEVTHAQQIELSLDRNDTYHVVYMNDGAMVARVEVNPPRTGGSGLAVVTVDTPVAAIRTGYDALRIFPRGGDKKYSLGHIRIK